MTENQKPLPAPFMEINNVNEVDQKEEMLEQWMFSTSQRPIDLAELFRKPWVCRACRGACTKNEGLDKDFV